MKLISHRGNLCGEKPLYENSPSYIEEAISEGFDVEIDLRVENNYFYLGHDEPQYFVSYEWLEKHKDVLWIHCKNLEALEKMSFTDFNYFYHEGDRYTLTSKSIIWVLIGQFPCANSVIVLPEKISLYYYEHKYFEICHGICSDVIKNYEYLKNI